MNDICDCQDSLCNYGGIERSIIDEINRNITLLKNNTCLLCSKKTSIWARNSLTCTSCSKGFSLFKNDLGILQNAVAYLCRTPQTQIYSYSFSLKEKQKMYQYLLHEQAGRCAICKTWWKDIKQQRKMNIDHNHINGYIRGLLCLSCNMALGYFHDSPEVIANAIDNFLGLEKIVED